MPDDSEKDEAIVEAESISNPVLKRLIEEVRQEDYVNQTNSFNRTHNRHNRGR